MGKKIKNIGIIIFGYVILSIVANFLLILIEKTALIETAFFIVLFGPISFLPPFFEGGLQERFLLFALSYIAFSLLVLPLLAIRCFKNSQLAKGLFYAGVIAWFGSGYISFLANTNA